MVNVGEILFDRFPRDVPCNGNVRYKWLIAWLMLRGHHHLIITTRPLTGSDFIKSTICAPTLGEILTPIKMCTLSVSVEKLDFNGHPSGHTIVYSRRTAKLPKRWLFNGDSSLATTNW